LFGNLTPDPGSPQEKDASVEELSRARSTRAAAKVMRKLINTILNIVRELADLFHPNLELFATICPLSNILMKGCHALQLILHELHLTPEASKELCFLDEHCA
jgi:hypothetical protein